MRVHLRITRVDGRIEELSLPLGTYQIGRDVGHIVLDDPLASGNHARIEVNPRTVVITDLGSSNGTFDPDGRRLTEPAAMQIDRAFRLGNSFITLTGLLAPSGGTILASPASVPAPPSQPLGPSAAYASPPAIAPASGHGGAGPTPRPHRPPNTGRFLVPGIVGGIIGALLSNIPLLSLLNLCFCMMSITGCLLGLTYYFQQNPHDKLTGTDAAVFGFISGATTGLISALFGLFGLLAWSPWPNLGALGGAKMHAIVMGSGAVVVFVSVVIHAGFGALGGFLGLQIFFNKRKVG